MNINTLNKGLVAWYPLDGEHQAKDVTPYGNHGTNNGATLSTGRKGEANGSYSFDGNNRIITANAPIDVASALTLSCWAKVNTTQGEKYGRFIGIENRWIIFLEQYKLSFYGSGINTIFTNSPAINDNEWHHLVVTYAGNGIKGYVDNVFVGTLAKTGNLDSTSGIDFTIGNRADLTRDLTGSIADARVYNRALEEDEIKLLYDSYKPKISTSSLEKGLVGHWMLDSENGAKDLTPNGNHGTANGGVTVGGATDRKGKTGGATTFDGVDDYIGGLKYREVNTGSISTWTYLTKSNSNSVFSSSIPNRFYLFLDTAIQIGLGDKSNVNVGLSNSIIMNKWAYLTFTWDSSSWKFYYDGTLINSGSYTGTPIIATTSKIGGTPTGIGFTDRPFGGKIYDLRIYNRVLSEEEIKLLYDQYKPKEASIGSLQKGLVLDMPLTTKHMKSATVVSDRTPYGNDGTVSGAIVGSQYTSFDGVDDYVQLDNSLRLIKAAKPFTISAWIKWGGYTGSTNNYQRIVELATDTYDNGFSLVIGNASSYTGIYFGGNGIINGQKVGFYPTLNEWRLITLIYNGNGMTNSSNYKIYYEGIYTPVVAETSLFSSSTLQNRIGRRGTTDSHFNGNISNVRIYNRALEEDEIKLLWEKGRY